MSINQIQKMSKTGPLLTSESQLDSRFPGFVCTTPTWHRAILEARLEKIAAGKAKFYCLDEVKRRLLK